ncbi:3-[(3aS,4S,7aS)-7a-methyl-1,5-dioxo-octahydro-1H-inden-4-yl]propanoyl:CoA ligase-like [Saccostrea echinata]|uniref:3-[(3aS,4S,7aS)-7a-methyl-1, 5-dioxo-octahydro-1H-inden-4-yl]propanoyl:CoA ligase-like n=1 Tax=Saccostrea echinata TaxID=191078 RepID=UPI002A82203B|nr:3-[(3aS,4S,7aS)-7a-methyl-1,5-dioxo-octahydro-1H-inden-4-yl]propanoyl:CoA ligase-like [Saccostrea echinata]
MEVAEMNFDQSYLRSSLITRAPYTTLTKLLQKWATVKPKQEACVFYTFGKPRTSITYEKLYQDAVMLAKGLLKLGIHKGDIIGIGGNNTIEWLVSTLGAQLAGARPLHFNFHDRSGESLKRIISKVGGCKMLIFDPGDNDVHWEICRKFLQVDSKTGVVVDSDIPSVKWVALHAPLESSKVCFTIEDVFSKENIKLTEVDPDDTGVIILTSGSTGFPKAVEYSHYRLIETAYNFLHVVGWDDKEDEQLSFFNDRPFYWIGGYPFLALVIGGKLITQANTLAFPTKAETMKHTSNIIEKAKPKIAFILIPFLLELLMSKDISWKIRTVITGGQPVPASCLEAIGKRYDTLSVTYGSTEAASLAGRMYSSPDKYIGLSPFPGVEMKIIGKDGMMVPLGTKGEVLSRSCLPFPGYINEAEKTAAVITPAGWYKTDDFGYINSAGYLEVFGRVSDVMEISGAKVLPSYLEKIIKRNPCVKEVVVFSIKDEIHCDDIPCAAVVKKEGVTLTEESLKDFIKQELNISEEARFMEQIYVPKYIVFHEKLPKTTTGKSDRKMTKSVSLPFIKQT